MLAIRNAITYVFGDDQLFGFERVAGVGATGRSGSGEMAVPDHRSKRVTFGRVSSLPPCESHDTAPRRVGGDGSAATSSMMHAPPRHTSHKQRRTGSMIAGGPTKLQRSHNVSDKRNAAAFAASSGAITRSASLDAPSHRHRTHVPPTSRGRALHASVMGNVSTAGPPSVHKLGGAVCLGRVQLGSGVVSMLPITPHDILAVDGNGAFYHIHHSRFHRGVPALNSTSGVHATPVSCTAPQTLRPTGCTAAVACHRGRVCMAHGSRVWLWNTTTATCPGVVPASPLAAPPGDADWAAKYRQKCTVTNLTLASMADLAQLHPTMAGKEVAPNGLCFLPSHSCVACCMTDGSIVVLHMNQVREPAMCARGSAWVRVSVFTTFMCRRQPRQQQGSSTQVPSSRYTPTWTRHRLQTVLPVSQPAVLPPPTVSTSSMQAAWCENTEPRPSETATFTATSQLSGCSTPKKWEAAARPLMRHVA